MANQQGLAERMAALVGRKYEWVKAGAQTAAALGLPRFNHSGRIQTLVSVSVDLGTAPTGATFIVDVFKNGTTLFAGGTGRPAVAIGAFTATATIPLVAGVAQTLADGDKLTATVTQIGSTVAGSDLVVTVNTK
jgi:hypothetical protein